MAGLFKTSAGVHNDLNSFANHFSNKVETVLSEAISVGSRAYREAVERGYDRAMAEVIKGMADALRHGGFLSRTANKGRSFNGAGNLTLAYRQDKDVTGSPSNYKRVPAIPDAGNLSKAKQKLRKEYLAKYGWTARNSTVKGAKSSFLKQFYDGCGRTSEANHRAINSALRDSKNRLQNRILSLEKEAELSKAELSLMDNPKFNAPNNFFKGYRFLTKDNGFSTHKKPSPSNVRGRSLVSWFERLSNTNPQQNLKYLRDVMGGLESHVSGNPFTAEFKQTGRGGKALKSPYFVKEDRKGKFSRVKIKDAILPNVRLKEGYSMAANGSVITPSGGRISAVSAAQQGVIGKNVTFTIMGKFYQAFRQQRQNAFMRIHQKGGSSKNPKYRGIFAGAGSIQGVKLEAMALDRDRTHGSIDPMTEAFIGLLDKNESIIFKFIEEELAKLAKTANTNRANTLGVALKIKVKQ